jgi:hypothetical protein
MSGEIVMQSEEAIERVLNMLRERMREALKDKRGLRCHAKAGIKPDTLIFGQEKVEEDGSFAFTMLIDRKQG